jgi:hypothetical protein
VCDIQLHITGNTHRGEEKEGVRRHKIVMCEMDMANPRVSHNLITPDADTKWTAVSKCKLRAPGMNTPWRVTSVDAVSATFLPLTPTYPGIQARIILKPQLESA